MKARNATIETRSPRLVSFMTFLPHVLSDVQHISNVCTNKNEYDRI